MAVVHSNVNVGMRANGWAAGAYGHKRIKKFAVRKLRRVVLKTECFGIVQQGVIVGVAAYSVYRKWYVCPNVHNVVHDREECIFSGRLWR